MRGWRSSFSAGLASLVLLVSPAAIAESSQDRHLTPAQIASDVALAEEVYTRIHPGYSRYTSADTLSTSWQNLVVRAQAENGLTVGEFYLGSSAVLADVRCDHTKAELPDALAQARNTEPVYLPMRWDMIEGRGFVTVPGGGTDLKRGDEILAVDGAPLDERVAAVLPMIPYDGETDWVRPAQVAQSYEFRGGGLDHFGALMFDPAPQAELTIKRGDEAPRVLTVDRITHPEWRAIGAGQVGARNFKDAIRFERIGDDTAYLAVDTFVNYRDPVNPAELYDPIFQALKDEKRTTLIVDLRRNGGGSDDAARGLIARLITAPAPFMRDIRVKTLDLSGLKDHIRTWDQNAMNPNPDAFKHNADGTYSIRKELNPSLQDLTPPATAFDGRLILLTSRNNASGSTHLLSFIKAQNPDAILIGEATGGSAEGATAGILFTLTLPESGIKMRVPAMQSFVNNKGFEPGLGMRPDILAPQTVESFLAGADPALDAAIELAQRSQAFDTAALK